MKAQLLSLTLVTLIATPRPSVAQPLQEAEKLLRGGRYHDAEKAFSKLGAKGLMGLARTQLEMGQAKKAATTAKRAARGKARVGATTLQAEALRRAGDLPGAVKVLRPLIKKKRDAYRARALLGIVYHEQGKPLDAKALFDGFYDDFAADKIDKASAAQLTYLAIACRYTNNFKDTHQSLRDALKVDATHVEAWLELAEISLEKYEAGHAEQHYLKVLAINPHHTRALIGMARVKQLQSNRLPPIIALLRKAQRVDPENAAARAIEAMTLIDNDDYQGAEALLKKALKQRPRHLESLAVYAASRFLQDDLKGYKRAKGKALALNKRYSHLFLIVMRLAERKHRYKEAVQLGKEALRVNPNDPYVTAEIGINTLRLGDEKEGLAYLRRAWQSDRYNVRNFNLLNLYDDVLAKEYVMISSK
ncbi:MAG: tetratricopeptide repeat protein, partial [Deltaproteobacteria bacterium]|nr:tetratricopeptide repeat protein [Deltaproteobacteria bacterium]